MVESAPDSTDCTFVKLQSTKEEAPVAIEKLPAVHIPQMLSPSVEYVPELHKAHDEDEETPDATENDPATQGKHTAPDL